MAIDLARRAELIKLARTLGCAETDITFLAERTSGQLRELRGAISAELYDRYGEVYRRVALASKLLPAGLCAQIAEYAFPPLITAGVAGEIGTERISDFARRLSVGYMADVTVAIDPRTVRTLIGAVPDDRSISVALELVERGENLTLGRMIDAAPDTLVAAVAAQVDSDETLLWIGFYAESLERLTTAVRALPLERLHSVVGTALRGEPEVQGAGLALLSRLQDSDLRWTVAEAAASAPDEVLEPFARTALAEGYVPELLWLVAGMSDASVDRVLALEVLGEDEMLHAIADAAAAGEQPQRLDRLVERLPPRARRALEDAGFPVG